MIGLAALIVFGLITIWTVYTGYTQNKEIERFTSDAPADLEITYRDADTVVAVRHRLREFGTTVRSGEASTLSLTAEDLNDLVGHEDRLFDFRKMIRFTDITANAVEARVAFPMQTLFQGGRLRYLNGSISFDPKVEEGQLMLKIVNIRPDVGGEVPSGFLNFISSNVNLLATLKDDKQLKPILTNIQQIRKENGQLHIVSE